MACLDFGCGIIDTGAFEVGQSGKRRPAVLHAGSDHDGLGADQLAVVESGAEAFVLEALEFHGAPRHCEARPELHRLYLAAPN